MLLLALVVATAVSTTFRSAAEPLPGEREAFNLVAFAQERYASEVVPATNQNAVDIESLLPALQDNLEAAGEECGQRQGTSPYTSSVEMTGVAGKPEGVCFPTPPPKPRPQGRGRRVRRQPGRDDGIKAGDMHATAMQPAALAADMAVEQAEAFVQGGETGEEEKQSIEGELITANHADHVGVLERL